MDNYSEKLQTIIQKLCPDAELTEHRGQLTFHVGKDKLLEVMTELKNNIESSFDQLLDITAIDWLRDSKRFELVYFLWSNKLKNRVRIKTQLELNEHDYPSVTSVYESANWYERETFDMYGIKFKGHPNLRRFYMPEDFNDPVSSEPLYPLRKDFPLMGIPDALPLPPYPEKYGEIE